MEETFKEIENYIKVNYPDDVLVTTMYLHQVKQKVKHETKENENCKAPQRQSRRSKSIDGRG